MDESGDASEELTNEKVLHQLSSGIDLAVQWLHNVSPEPKSSLLGLRVFLKRLNDQNKLKRKTKSKEEKSGIAGQAGTHAYWLKEKCKIPKGHISAACSTPTGATLTASTPEAGDSVLIPISSPITRREALDLREELTINQVKISEMQETNTVLQSTVEGLKIRTASKNAELKRVRSRETSNRGKVQRLENKIDETRKVECESKGTQFDSDESMKQKDEILTLREQLKEMETEMSELKGKKKSIENYDVTSRCYTPKFREMVYKLLQEHVGLDHISPVIQAVFEYCGNVCDKLPSEKTYRRFNLERLKLSHIQLAEELPDKSCTTIYSDETSKKSEKYIGFHVTDSEKRHYVLGIRDLATKSANDTFNCFQEILKDIDNVKETSNSSVAKSILANIRNTMSDRAATELKWHQQLENYRKNILPEMTNNWDSLTDEERRPIEKLHNFYCGLHSYVQAAEVSGAALLSLEPQDQDKGPRIILGNEPGSVRLIRTAAKAFARGADEMSGCNSQFQSYQPLQQKLSENQMSVIPIVPFRGNRFNIIFFNGGFVYFLHEEMKAFLEGQPPPLNKLLQSVLLDLKDPLYVGGCKALGLLSKLLLGPLWRIIEDNSIHIYQFGELLKEILSNLDRVCTSDFMNGNVVLCERPEWIIKRDKVFDFLISSNEKVDVDAETSLKVIIPAVSKLFKDHYGDLMAVDSTELDTECAQSVVKHNKFIERVFAYTDHLLKFKPNITHIAQESYIMFCLNKTADWLEMKSENERNNIIKNAMRDTPALHVTYLERKKEIKRQREENLTKKREEEERRKLNVLKERETIFKDILYFGLYQSEEQLERGLEQIKGVGEKSDALKAQLRFREKILEQPADPKLFRFSEKEGNRRRNLKWTELNFNCLALIRLACESPTSPDELSKASYLVGRKIIHKLVEKEDEHDEDEVGVEKEYSAMVISIVPGYPAWYNIKYDSCDSIYVEKVQEEMKKGNIKLKETFEDQQN